ncbi:BTB/POZ domain-containing protein At1g01640-like [Zingiber officinale]|uniref:BTB/POZ domain-containing protein At1g01640-like n=1 Tax=Zingiber officinale TaxID=94328 RepID=UPI001C4C7C69|nr:BTB/POZ domain-containing protein At1g01640-like [Zingiber officinale]
MDCAICSCRPMVQYYTNQRNFICDACYDGAKSMMTFLNTDLDGDAHRKAAASISHGSNSLPPKGIRRALERMKEMQGREKATKEKVAFLDGLAALSEGLHADILVKAGDGQPVPAHRAVLASRSEIFKTMLLADDCKAAPAGGIVSLPELTHRELRHLLEFLYTGELPPVEQDLFSTVLSLLSAADKYDIPFLRKSCERWVLADLRVGNVLDVLDAAHRCSGVELKERAMRVVVEKAEEVLFSPEFEAFAGQNSDLCVEITRALVNDKTKQKVKHEPVNKW